MPTPTPDDFLTNMRAKLDATPREKHGALIDANIKAFQQRYARIEEWAANDGVEPYPYPGLDAWGCARIVSDLFMMKGAL